MGLLQTAYYAKVLKGDKGASTTPKPTSISDSIAQRPIQWLIVAGAVIYFGGKFIKKVIPTGSDVRKKEAETETSADNPWSANTFLAQTIPPRTNILTAYGASQQAKKLYDALENWFFDDADIAVGIFTALPSKVQVAQVVKSFEALYSRNVLEFLKSGKKTFDFWTGGISEELYNQIIENVKRKPKF